MVVARLDTTDSNRLCMAPSEPREVLMAARAASTEAMAVLAPATLEISVLAIEVPDNDAAVVAAVKPVSAIVPVVVRLIPPLPVESSVTVLS